MVKSNLKLVDLSLKLLLDTETLTLGSLFSLNGSSKRFHSTGMILSGVVEFLLLFSNTSVNLLSDIGKLKLGTENSVLLHLKGSLSLLKHTSLFVKSMDGASTLTKLV